MSESDWPGPPSHELALRGYEQPLVEPQLEHT